MIAALWIWLVPILATPRSGSPDLGPSGTMTSTASQPRTELGAISLLIPATWQRRERSGTHRFDSPKGDAYFVVDTGQVQTAGMEPSTCLSKIMDALGTEGGEWHKLILGGFPAAHRSNVDTAKGGAVTVRTHSFVGCNGATTWSILFSLDEKLADQYEPQVVALAKSLEFISKPGGDVVTPPSPSPEGPAPRAPR